MQLILCNTNLAVTTVVCQIVRNPEKQFIVFTDVKNIHKFLSLIDLPNMELHFIISNFRYFAVWQIWQTRRLIKHIVSRRNITTVYCYHQAFGGLYNWIINHCHKIGCQMIYFRVLNKLELPKAKNDFNAIKIKIQYKFLFSTDIDVLDRGNRVYIPKLSSTFYRKNEIKEEKYTVDDNIINYMGQLVLTKLGIASSKGNILLLTGSVLATDQVTIKEYTKKIKELINTIGINHIIAKCHPRFGDEIEEEKKLIHLPSFIPMEFLMNHFNIFIGYNSTVLIEATNKGKIAISLLLYLTPINNVRRNRWFSYFRNCFELIQE